MLQTNKYNLRKKIGEYSIKNPDKTSGNEEKNKLYLRTFIQKVD